MNHAFSLACSEGTRTPIMHSAYAKMGNMTFCENQIDTLSAAEAIVKYGINSVSYFRSPSISHVGIGRKRTLRLPYDANMHTRLEQFARTSAGLVFVVVPFLKGEEVLAIEPEMLFSTPFYQRNNGASDQQNEPIAIPDASFQNNICQLEFESMVKSGINEINNRRLDKVVLSRQVQIGNITKEKIAKAMNFFDRAYKDTYTFLLDGFFGSSPELLVSKTGLNIKSVLLAGSIRRGKNAAEDAALVESLNKSEKDNTEHKIVAEMVADIFSRFCSRQSISDESMVAKLSNIAHLATVFTGRLNRQTTNISQILETLHPTPAIAGSPIDEAIKTIMEIEKLPRERYGGAVGWIDNKGDGEFALSIRCAQIRQQPSEHVATAYAGCGIVKESSPSSEWSESCLKLRPVVEAIYSKAATSNLEDS